MHSFQITINGEDVTAYACYPFGGTLALDTSLDQAYIELRASPRKEPYTPFSEIIITQVNSEESEPDIIIFILASDEVETVVKTGLSTHRLLLCEETKKLERVICPGKTFVQPLIHNYATDIKSYPEKVDGIESQYSVSELINIADLAEAIVPPVDPAYYNTSDTYTISKSITGVSYDRPPALRDVFETANVSAENNYNRLLQGYAFVAIDENLDVIATIKGSKGNTATNQNPIPPELPVGGYTIYYIANFSLVPKYGGNSIPSIIAAAYDFAIIPPETAQKPPLYISDVTEQLLEIAEPIRRFEEPRFKLSVATKNKYAKTECAELNFTNGATLRENLDEIAGTVHCITRLKNNEVFFEELGQTEEVDYNKLGAPVSIKSSNNVEKYASHLDANVDNMMNMQDPSQGAVSDPFRNIFRTVRSETSISDARTTADNCLIKTEFPIQKPIKLLALFQGEEYDLTPFLYEKKEYDLLETNGGVYPYTKSYALYYIQGQPNIYGLTFRQENWSELIGAFKRRAIENVLAAAGAPVGDDPWDSSEILNYLFNVEYISAIRGRVRQAKKDIEDINTPSAMAFNQSAPRLSSVNFGERLKGELAMMSEPIVKYCFKTSSLSAVMSSIGKIYKADGVRYYVSQIDYHIWKGYVIAEFTLSRNFNQLGRFVSINNSFRQFEIDDNSQEEMIVYEDYAVFSTQEPSENVKNDALDYQFQVKFCMRGVFEKTPAVFGNSDVSAAYVQTFDQNYNPLAIGLLPVQSLALGNSLLFNFNFKDNYSAGEFLQPQGEYKLTRQLPYGDPLYGEAKYLAFELWNDTHYLRDNDPVEIGDAIPRYRYFGRTYTFATGADFGLIINKSSRDIPNITYQLHHVTDSGLIFGKALTQKNPLVRPYTERESYVITLPFELNPLAPPEITYYHYKGAEWNGEIFSNTEIAFGDKHYGIAYELPSLMSISKGFIIPKIPDDQVIAGAKSWAIYRRGENDAAPEFLIGANGAPADVYVYLTHNPYKED